jgi:hypothetical protein
LNTIREAASNWRMKAQLASSLSAKTGPPSCASSGAILIAISVTGSTGLLARDET